MTTWRMIQRQNFIHWQELLNFLEIPLEQHNKVLPNPRFPLNLPLRIAQKIQKNNLLDPLLRQFLPLAEETLVRSDFVIDPVYDATFRKEKKLLKKYEGRALLICSSACAMNCRFCFRQNFEYETTNKGFEEELKAIQEDSTLSEIILSGGDPLSLSNNILGGLINSLAKIPHVKRIRFHTRFPIGIPERIDLEFLAILERCEKQIFFIIHCNHASELDEEIIATLKSIQRLGIPVLCQTVLLKGVNDNIPALEELCEKLTNHGILPYYLHQLDKVQGTAHFDVEVEAGRRLIQELSAQISGYAVPKYVQENAGQPGKTLL